MAMNGLEMVTMITAGRVGAARDVLNEGIKALMADDDNHRVLIARLTLLKNDCERLIEDLVEE